mmetsp:Transcript_1585/g.2721  ORF Transcript_1585/g.2721 Transcript_1585/m.2721 type:complete len:82 (+) Transcript_1585:1056-1301(+)
MTDQNDGTEGIASPDSVHKKMEEIPLVTHLHCVTTHCREDWRWRLRLPTLSIALLLLSHKFKRICRCRDCAWTMLQRKCQC